MRRHVAPLDYIRPSLAILLIATGGALHLGHSPTSGERVWLAGVILLGVPLAIRTVKDALRGHFATDIVATLAVLTAILLREPLAGLVVVLMQTGGEALERYAAGRASRALQYLEDAAPRIAHRITAGSVEDIPVDAVRVGDALLVRPGEMAPCDAVVEEGTTLVDTSRLTGEPFPQRVSTGSDLMSGAIIGDSALRIRATSLAAESQYARIVALVRSAQMSKAPLQRMADRYAVWFTPLTLIVCAVAYLISGDSLRVLAVLVVATPCPLILAAPVAIVGGINVAARKGIIVRNGAALERIGECTSILLDKTGTLTIGMPRVATVKTFGAFKADHVLSLAGAVEQVSSHLLARTLVEEVRRRDLRIPDVSESMEMAGRGVVGRVNGHQVVVGAMSLARELFPELDMSEVDGHADGARLFAVVVVDGELAGVVEYADEVRAGSAALIREMASMGLTRQVLLSGDSQANAEAIAKVVGISEVYGDQLPGDKVAFVQRVAAEGEKVLVVGDGTNDAPALTAATVGVAMGGHGGGITTESADIVLLKDDISRVADAVRIGRRTIGVARESIWAGLGLSAVAMVFAALGHIPPTIGALLQEGIDVAVILNALRASRD